MKRQAVTIPQGPWGSFACVCHSRSLFDTLDRNSPTSSGFRLFGILTCFYFVFEGELRWGTKKDKPLFHLAFVVLGETLFQQNLAAAHRCLTRPGTWTNLDVLSVWGRCVYVGQYHVRRTQTLLFNCLTLNLCTWKPNRPQLKLVFLLSYSFVVTWGSFWSLCCGGILVSSTCALA